MVAGSIVGLQEKLRGYIDRILPQRVRLRPESLEDYMVLAYFLLAATGLHLLVILRYAPAAALLLYELIGGSPLPFMIALEGLALALALYTFYTSMKLYTSKPLGFAYGLYQVNTVLPYLGLVYMTLGAVKPGPQGLQVSPLTLALAGLYVIVSLAILAVVSRAEFYLVELYKVKSGSYVKLRKTRALRVEMDEGDVLRIVFYGRRGMGQPHLVIEHPELWDTRERGGPEHYEAILRARSPLRDTITLKVGAREVVRINVEPPEGVQLGVPDTVVELELIIPSEGGKSVRKVIVQRPGGVTLSQILRDTVPRGFSVVRILKVARGGHTLVRDPEKEVVRRRSRSKYIVELAAPMKTPKPIAGKKAKPAEAGIPASAPPTAPRAEAEPVEVEPVVAPLSVNVESRKLTERVKELLEEYSSLREDLW